MCKKFFEETKAFDCHNIMLMVLLLVFVSIITIAGSIRASATKDEITTEIIAMINAQTAAIEVTYEDGEINVIESENIQFAYTPIYISESNSSSFSLNTIAADNSEENFESETVEIDEDAQIVDIEPETVVSDIIEPYTWFGGYSDIGSYSAVTAEQLDACTEYYSKYQSFDNQFLGKGYVFIEAGKQSGLDPLWLYAVSVYESGWGTSDLAINKSNYYGIGAWDTDITKAKVMADDFENGIINGAIWIADHYYNNGMNSMQAMNSVPNHSYAPGNTVWIPTISEFINNFIWTWRI